MPGIQLYRKRKHHFSFLAQIEKMPGSCCCWKESIVIEGPKRPGKDALGAMLFVAATITSFSCTSLVERFQTLPHEEVNEG
jgi:hypothetical protein